MAAYRQKLQELLRELFQFDCADLDFGIYRIMNHKREVIEGFIQKDLIEAVSAELSSGVLRQQSQDAAALQEVARRIREAMGASALDGDGRLAEAHHNTPLGRRYLELQARTAGAKDYSALEAHIFNHLYAFFSRYYDNGDFLSRRRYSKKEKYAIPYNGEEVYLHWANKDQYYVKTGEYFADYRFKSHGLTVHLRLRDAAIEKDNKKGEKRFFVPAVEDAVFDAGAEEIVIPFEFRPLTGQEKEVFGNRNVQEALIAEALAKLPKRFEQDTRALGALLAVHHKGAEGREISFLEHHLGRYTRRNTADFFIHKDLKGFLQRELDFYLKNEVLNLDELVAAGETRAEGWFQIVRVMRTIGMRIIEFLAQIEDFQKKLWEKRKFITEVQYCITLHNVPEAFYPEIVTCEAQWDEWRKTLSQDMEDRQANLLANGLSRAESRLAFLKEHPTLVLDTRHFPSDLVDRLLASFQNLDEAVDGLLIHGENFQALSLLRERYKEKVKCIYIDPPYNTGNDEFIYCDQFQHSSWLAMMENRLRLACECLARDGTIFVSVDDGEQARLRELLASIMGGGNFVNNIIWQKKFSPQNDARWLSDNHDFLVCYAKDKDAWRPRLLPRGELQDQRYENPDHDPRGPWMSSDLTVKTYSQDYDYPITTPSGRVVKPPESRCWFTSRERMEELVADNRVWFGANGNGVPRLKRFLSETKQGLTPLTIWTYQEVGHNQEGKQELKQMFTAAEEIFGTPKPVRLVSRVVAIGGDKNGLILDFFAGSGTTGHAIINLNREDGGKRRFILVEMADYFETILLPRIKKIVFAPEWSDGRPARLANPEEVKRSPRIIKYIRIESYEDALNNISFPSTTGRRLLEFDDYLLKYVLDWETRGSATLLNVEMLASPFSYELTLIEGQEVKKKRVDIPETFNYLLGLHVQRRLVFRDGDRRYLVYRGELERKRVAIIWRETKGWGREDYERDKRFVAGQKIAEGADEIFVNGDSFIPGARALEPIFKSRMFGGV